MDIFPRESKEGGAWCDAYRSYRLLNGKPVTPVVTVVCNFTKPTADLPSLFSMDETETLFHEFGHALEGLMCKTSYPTSYVAQDFVELPSQIMEHWAFNPEVLKMYAKHYKTGEIIPDALIQKINNSSLFNQGFATTEYLAASYLDMAYHTQKDIKDIDIAKFEKDYFAKIGLIPQMDSRYRSTYFGHITGGYDAGYYGYIWAAVLDNDAFDAFKEKGIFDKETATSFRKNVLEKDGSEDPTKMYVNFRGREAKIEPLLKSRGLL
jgi:peptidyl-dipeptidase Dcp